MTTSLPRATAHTLPAALFLVLILPAGRGFAAEPDPVATPAVFDPAAFWASCDSIARATLVILAVMSVASWSILLVRGLSQLRLQFQLAAAERWFARDVPLDPAALKPGSPLRVLLDLAAEARARYRAGSCGGIDYADWLILCLRNVLATLVAGQQGGLSFLATVASTAPFVGLFGTVWGVHNALLAIGRSGQATLDKVAGPVGEALTMTALGLAVAVPAVLAYNFLSRRDKALGEGMRLFVGRLHTRMLSEEIPSGSAS